MNEPNRLTRTAARPLTDRNRAVRRKLLRRFPRVLWIFWVAMLLFTLTTTDHTMMGVLLVGGVWELCAFLWYRVPRGDYHAPVSGRIEIHEQGVVYRSPIRRKVIPFSRVTAFWETPELLMLCSDKTEIVWQANDLTRQDAETVRALVTARIPSGTVRTRGLVVPRLAYPLDVPQEAECVAPATVRCVYDATGGIVKEWGTLLCKAGGIYLYLSVWLAWLMTENFLWDTPFLNSSLFWCAAVLMAGFPLLTLALCAAIRRGRKKLPYAVGMTDRGLYLTDGVEQKVLPRGLYRATARGRACEVRLAGGATIQFFAKNAEELAILNAITVR